MKIGSRRKRLAVGTIAALLVIAVIAGFIAVMKSPANGSISQNTASGTRYSDPYAKPGRYDGKYISFTYPADYQKLNTHKPEGGTIESAEYYSTLHLSRDLTITVQREALQDETGYLLRVKQSDIYKAVSSSPGLWEFVKSGDSDSEIVAFMPHGDMLASLSITAPTQQDLQGDMDIVKNSLKWK
jgi:hypothetical protein